MTNEYQREYREKRKAKGICGKCKARALPGRVHCESCAEADRRRAADRHTRRKARGLCSGCGKRKAAGLCEPCRKAQLAKRRGTP